MRHVALVLVPLLLLACDSEPVAPAEGVAPSLGAASEREELALAVDYVGYNQCLGEDLHATGTTIVSANTVATAQETRTSQHGRVADDWQMVGLTTGDLWLPVPGVHSTIVGTWSGDFLTLQERFVFENQTTGVVLDWPARFTFVTNASGEVKVARFQFDDCTIRH